MSAQAARIAAAIEHTLLRPEATPSDIDRLCDEALEHGFCGVCVNPIYVARAVRRLERTSVKVVTVAGFPLGASLTDVKSEEARRAIADGAEEIDMVAALGPLRAGDATAVQADIQSVARVVHDGGAGRLLKVILETSALTTEETILGCRCCRAAQADLVKTSTGLHPSGGATVQAVRLLHQHASPLAVKAAGGIRDAATAAAMLEAGAARIGTSSGVAIMGSLLSDR